MRQLGTIGRMAVLLAAMMAFGSLQADAQIGNLLKKAKKAAETASGLFSPKRGDSTASSTDGAAANPLASMADIELVGAYGKTASENYGQVYLVLKVKMKANVSTVGFGGVNNTSMMAVDQDGNAYEAEVGPYGMVRKPVTEGVEMKVTLDDERLVFRDVKRAATRLQQVRLGCFVDQANKGMLTFKDVPIQWDVTP